MTNQTNSLVKRLKELGDYKPGARTTSQTQPDLKNQVADVVEERYNSLSDFASVPETVTTKPKKQSSFVAVLCDLEVGSSAVRNHSPNPDITLAKLAEELSEMKAMISNNVRPSVRIATEKTGFTYSVETSQTITSAGRVYVQVIVTRTA